MRRSIVWVAVLALATTACRKKTEQQAPAPPPAAADATTAPPASEPAAAAGVPAATGAATEGPAEPAAATEREYLLGTVGDFTVLRMYAEGFEKLPLGQKRLAYHLYRAAIAGDRIFYDQHHPLNLKIKDLLEVIVLHLKGIESPLLEKFETFLELVWINHGVHDTMNGDKMAPEFTFEELREAAHAAVAPGRTEVVILGFENPEALDARLEEIRGLLFDPEVDPYTTRRTVPEGMDLLTASANNYYEGVTLADLEGFTERYPLNSKLIRRDGELVELVYRAGGDGVEPGMYAPELAAAARHLRAAAEEAGEGQRRALGLLADYFVSGDPAAFREYNIAWVADNPPVDAIVGFIEVYADPRNQKGGWEGVVFVPDAAQSAAIHKLADNAAYFESKLPYAEAYKRTEFNPPLANLVVSIVHTGDAGPVSPAGINLPNAQDIRERYGSKSIDIGNLGDAVDTVTGDLAIREFAFADDERERGVRCIDFIRRHGIAFHEVIGHGSGRVSPDLAGDPADHLPGYYNTIEEARAELVALYLAFDPKTIEIGMLPDEDCALAVNQSYLRAGLVTLRRLPPGGIVEEDHWRAILMIARYAIDKGAARVEQRDGKFYFVMSDPETWKTTIGELLAELMRIKAEGDLAAAKSLVETYGARYEEAWRDDVMRRIEAIGYPKKYAFVSPILRPVTGPDGEITDVVAEPAESLAAMQLEWDALHAEDVQRR